ncbi:MAG: PAS domain S-box protein [Gammaproteobacteria bacterium]|nr:PAS domain S-box protein [Gammaproteobacteria bacterium]
MQARPRSFHIGLGIRARLTLWFVLGAVGAVVLGSVVVYASGVASIQETLGQTYCQIASRTVGQFEDHFRRESAIVRNIATDVLTTEVVMELDQVYRNRPGRWIEARLERQAEDWHAASTPRARMAYLHPQLSHRLSVLAGIAGDSLERLSVYDTRGVLVGASSPPARRNARDQTWFRAVAGKEKHFTYLDANKGKGSLTVVIPVWGGIEIVGFAAATYNQTAFAKAVDNIRFGESGEAVLVDYAGVPLSGEARPFLIHALAQKPPASAAEPGLPYWVSIPEEGDWPFWERLACVAPVGSINSLRTAFDLPPWSIVVTQSPHESYVALRHSLGSFAAAGVLGVFVVGLGGAFIAWHIASPLRDLQEGVRSFARGERGRRVQVSTADEIGELAAEFNRMAERVTASEQELRAFAQAVEDAADAIIMTRPDGTIYYANPAFETVTGYSRREVRGGKPSILRSGKTPGETYDSLWGAVNSGRPWRGELTNQRKSGELYPVDLTVSPIHDADGNVISLLGIHRDISLAREYQEKLEREVQARTREIAQTQSLAAMGRMASMVAHDLRNALSTVKMNLQILFRRHSDSADIESEHCRMGLDQVRYMEEILRDMLSYAQPEALHADWCDLPPIIDDALLAFAHGEAERDVRIVREDSRGLPKVYCDRTKVTEVLRNLVENALHAMPDGGTLSITARLVLATPEPMVQVFVRDTGEGVADDVLPNMFEPFFTTRTKGSGLGLAIVKRIIDQHGGEVNVDSKLGAGTTVAFTLPTTPLNE